MLPCLGDGLLHELSLAPVRILYWRQQRRAFGTHGGRRGIRRRHDLLGSPQRRGGGTLRLRAIRRRPRLARLRHRLRAPSAMIRGLARRRDARTLARRPLRARLLASLVREQLPPPSERGERWRPPARARLRRRRSLVVHYEPCALHAATSSLSNISPVNGDCLRALSGKATPAASSASRLCWSAAVQRWEMTPRCSRGTLKIGYGLVCSSTWVSY